MACTCEIWGAHAVALPVFCSTERDELQQLSVFFILLSNRGGGKGWQKTLPESATTHAKPDLGAILCMGLDNTKK